MKNILVIAQNTLKETIRDRILYGIMAFAVVFLMFTVFLGSISLGEDLAVIRNLGLAGIYFFGMVVTIFLGASLMYKEFEKRTLYFILSKPVRHRDVIWGKFLGLVSSVTLTTILMAVVYLAVVAAKGGGVDAVVLEAIALQIAEMGLFVALTIFFSTIAAPLASTLYAILVLYIGHSLSLLTSAVKTKPVIVQKIVLVIYYLFPNLEKFNIRNSVIYGIRIPWPELFLSLAYAIVYIILLLLAATAIFKEREL
ncbi:MAG: ABC transporter permease subunit [Candidatus Sungbacteria bacterium]|uniref:ABC transporter permease subunit n=1 Tax=Candidatus Sungiibacteriota bacterium TaxID=2750080 RepID=A0A9D6LT52_9BACT|nr:ABC transporter permease subunit [Candidatus Sungbacteria bacterium]